jgi:hypothetical protein
MNEFARLGIYTSLLVILTVAAPAHADSATGTTIATITRFLSITNISNLEFGTVSAGSAAGSVIVDSRGKRSSTGGVVINPNETFTPARFVIQGKPNGSFTVSLPTQVELTDTTGNTIAVNNIRSNMQNGRLDNAGELELTVGGQINLDANQSSGDYSGILVVELNYS